MAGFRTSSVIGERRIPTVRRFPVASHEEARASAWNGGRSRLPLRGSPGVSPGSLLILSGCPGTSHETLDTGYRLFRSTRCCGCRPSSMLLRTCSVACPWPARVVSRAGRARPAERWGDRTRSLLRSTASTASLAARGRVDARGAMLADENSAPGISKATHLELRRRAP